MVVDGAWLKRNIGFDPGERRAPAEAFSFAPASRPKRTAEDLQREIIDFDSEAPEGRAFFAFTKSAGLSAFTDIPWPNDLAPKPAKSLSSIGKGPLPKADALIVTWTVDEGHALSRVLTPGKDSKDNWIPYTHNFTTISKKMRGACPALEAKRLGTFWAGTIGQKKIVFFKSDSHLSQDTKHLPSGSGTLPNYDVWKQIIDEVKPSIVLTTGTAGGIGKDRQVGDVIVSPIVRFDGIKWLSKASFHNKVFSSSKPKQGEFAAAATLFQANAHQLPSDNSRPPEITVSTTPETSVVTTDFFGFDTSDDHFHLQGLGDVSEMGDAVLGQVAQDMSSPPRWLAVRNVSDPQIKAEGTLGDETARAADIYKAFGRWSTVCSAIVCWALIAAEP